MKSPVNLLLATIIDMMDVGMSITHLRNSIRGTKQDKTMAMTVPQAYNLVLEYERVCGRSYNEQTRYYIVAALWDQGYVKVGSIQEWK